jgi:hypothetical protein
MKITFTNNELTWLNVYVNTMRVLANKHRDEDGGELLRLTTKMQYKFTPNASYVHLTQKERKLVIQMAAKRLTYMNQDIANTEHEVVKSILGKVQIA